MKERVRFTVAEILEATGGELLAGSPDAVFESITTDSRVAGEADFFVPLRGEKYDGHDFIPDLINRKRVAGLLTMVPVDAAAGIPVIQVNDTLHALGALGRFHRMRSKAGVIAVTGTNGKTTTKEILQTIFAHRAPTLASEKNYNNEVGVPFTLFRLAPEHRYAVIEMGMNHAGEISRLSSYACPDAAIITNAGEGHLEFLGSVENVARAKSEIMEPMGPGSLILLNRDSASFNIMEDAAKRRGLKIVTFGLHGAEICPDSYELSEGRIAFTLRAHRYEAALYGIHNLYNLLAATGLALQLGLHAEEIAAALAGITGVGKRSEIIDCGFLIINDTYNSNPLSLRSALHSLGEIYASRRKIAVLADMKELGDKAEFYHREAAREVMDAGFDALYTYGDMARHIAESALERGMDAGRVKHFTDKDALITTVADTVSFGDVVLIKGSRSMKMEEVAERLVRAQ